MNMKKILIGATLAISAMSMMAELAARPMGGGRSVGRQSQNVSKMPAQSAQAPAAQRQATQAPAATPPAAPPVKPPSPWKGILGGALLGLGLGALLSHFGLGGALASAISSILMIALIGGVIFFIVRMIRNKSAGPRPAPAAFGGNGGGFGGNSGGNSGGNVGGFGAPQGGSSTPEIGSRLQPSAFQPAQPAFEPAAAPAPVPHQQWGVPADFDQPAFLRHAKSNFIRLQAAWDKSDVNDIREFTTPEVFAELKMQIQERGGKADFTDVVTIDAELLGIENNGTDYLASVKFTGQIKPAPDALAEPFNEVWNLVKPVSGSGGWLLGGIQQLA
ncbi:Tim44 domain-containing protein [Massilia sp. YIM B04103]|uniref:Tim44 domain-containing protein n=1 Tax=Massilia sp. YIM B04103 TaxID=2963106 RepID=UPI00210B2B5C|nr:Tim44-like domain-containing protein [Massilia sp. YIM B04103]